MNRYSLSFFIIFSKKKKCFISNCYKTFTILTQMSFTTGITTCFFWQCSKFCRALHSTNEILPGSTTGRSTFCRALHSTNEILPGSTSDRSTFCRTLHSNNDILPGSTSGRSTFCRAQCVADQYLTVSKIFN